MHIFQGSLYMRSQMTIYCRRVVASWIQTQKEGLSLSLPDQKITTFFSSHSKTEGSLFNNYDFWLKNCSLSLYLINCTLLNNYHECTNCSVIKNVTFLATFLFLVFGLNGYFCSIIVKASFFKFFFHLVSTTNVSTDAFK